MKLLLCSMIWMLAAGNAGVAPRTATESFHVQLVRGTDAATPPTPESKPIGWKLAAAFRPVFRCEYFWEVQHHEVHLLPGASTRLRLTREREVEIDLGTRGKRIVTAYSDGRPVTRAQDCLKAPMTLLGGDRDSQSVWFIVVRRDRPTTD